MNVRNKLQCLSLATFSCLVCCIWVARPGSNPRVEQLKGASPASTPASFAKIRLGMPATNTSLLQTFINYDRKSFYNIGSRSLPIRHSKRSFRFPPLLRQHQCHRLQLRGRHLPDLQNLDLWQVSNRNLHVSTTAFTFHFIRSVGTGAIS